MNEEVTLPEIETVYVFEEPNYTCTQKGVYSFTCLKGHNYTLDLDVGDVVYFDPFRVERRYEKLP